MSGKKIRVLIAKPGLDGHDRGAKLVAFALRDAGMEVIYSGLHQSIDQIVSSAIQESVDVLGLSIMTGAHLPICRELMKRLEKEDALDIHVVVGGVIPNDDIAELEAMGVKGAFPNGARFDHIVSSIQSLI